MIQRPEATNHEPQAVFPSHYLPNLLYFKFLLQGAEVLIEKHQNYIKQTYSNRCIILGSNGLQTLSIPIQKIHSQKQAIHQVKINYEEDWQKQHWLAFQSAYGKSAFWFYYKDFFEPFYFEKKIRYLLEFNQSLLQLILKLLKADISISFTQNFEKTYSSNNDYRNFFDPKKRNEAEQNASLTLKKYIQVFEGKFPFERNLSIMDLLMNEGPKSIFYLREN